MEGEKKRVSIKRWSEDERPRERLLKNGASSLSNAELLAILLRSGTRKMSALEVARELLSSCNNNLRELAKLNYEELIRFEGIGAAKAVGLMAHFELNLRVSKLSRRELPPIKSSQYAAEIIAPLLRDLSHEECWVMYLNRANRLIDKERLTVGGVSSTIVDVKILVKRALEKLASSLILIHNHPSGNLSPGESDKIQTQIVKEAAALFDIKLLDHLIIAGDDYFSFADDGII